MSCSFFSDHPSSRVRRTPRRRDGFTLVEMLLVLTLTTSLLAGAIGLLTVLSKSNRQAQQNLSLRQEIRRFADALRSDVRVATRTETTDLRLVIDHGEADETISYEIGDSGTVERVVTGPDDERISGDRFRISRDGSISIESVESSGVSAVRWTIVENHGNSPPIQIFATPWTSQ